mmetsp:Transcript_9581/g.23861  ORF Transcript_9581/g.23861 Transcript_9581/m.23861 type:complete len:223 (+) Transcript_9581:1439-2107(+)
MPSNSQHPLPPPPGGSCCCSSCCTFSFLFLRASCSCMISSSALFFFLAAPLPSPSLADPSAATLNASTPKAFAADPARSRPSSPLPADTDDVAGGFFLLSSKPRGASVPSRFSSLASSTTLNPFTPVFPSPVVAAARALSTCCRKNRACRTSSASSARFRFPFSLSRSCSSSSLATSRRNHPFGVSSTLHFPVRPRCTTNSVSVVHFVEFICTWLRSAMNSL